MIASVVRPLPLPRGVAAPGGERGFVATPAGGVAAVGLASGRLAWSAALEGTPWVADARMVVVAAPRGPETVALTVLHTADGTVANQLAVSAPAALAAPAGDFELELSLAGSELLVGWRLPTRYEGGAPPPPFVRAREARDAAGALRCDLETGAVEAMAPERVGLRAALGEPSWPYRRRGVWQETPWRADGGLLRLELDATRPRLWLRREDGRGVLIGEGEAFEPVVTPCGRFLFLRQTVPAGLPWRVLALPIGAQLGALHWPPNVQLPTVLGQHAFCLRGATLVATDLATDATLWELDLGGGSRDSAPQLRGHRG